MYSSSTKVEYAIDITLGRIARLESYGLQRKKNAKNFGFHSYVHSILIPFCAIFLGYFIHNKVL
jgi:hypothetical protein